MILRTLILLMCTMILLNVILDLAHHDLACRDLAHHGLARHDLAHRGLARHDLAHRGLARHDLAHRDLARHDLAHCGLARHDLAHRDLARHDLAHRDLARHDLARRDLARHDVAHHFREFQRSQSCPPQPSLEITSIYGPPSLPPTHLLPLDSADHGKALSRWICVLIIMSGR
jgi:uncharacterized protein YjbI with pentapeptide repeats